MSAARSSIFDATDKDIEMLLAAQAHMGSKNLQVRTHWISRSGRYKGFWKSFQRWLEMAIGPHGPICVEDKAWRYQHYQHRKDLVSLILYDRSYINHQFTGLKYIYLANLV